MLDLDQSAKKDASLVNSSIPTSKPALTAQEIALAAHLLTTALSALVPISAPEEEFAQAAPTPATLVMDPMPAPAA